MKFKKSKDPRIKPLWNTTSNFAQFFKFVTLTLSCYDIGSDLNKKFE